MSAVLEKVTKNSKIISNDVIERVILHGISWETYERILNEHDEKSNKRFFYDNGDLEIMTLGYQHEKYSDELSELLVEIARILEIDYQSAGSTTFRRDKKKRGFEGDGSFYFENAEVVRRKKTIDLSNDPPPELVIEIDITHGSLPRFPIFASLGIKEVWRFDGEKVTFYHLQNQKYKEVSKSVCLPKVSSRIVTNLLFSANDMKRLEWLKLIHEAIKKD
jgi:Uma2 family endonuclease